MRIVVEVKPRAKKNSVQKLTEAHYRVCVTAPPEKGKANAAVIDALAEYFGASKSGVHLVMGSTAREKVFDIG